MKRRQRYIYQIVFLIIILVAVLVAAAVVFLLKQPALIPNETKPQQTVVQTTESVANGLPSLDQEDHTTQLTTLSADLSSAEGTVSTTEAETYPLPHEREGFWVSYDHRKKEVSADGASKKSLFFDEEKKEVIPLRLYADEIGRLTFYNDTNDDIQVMFFSALQEETKQFTTTVAAHSEKQFEITSDQNQTITYAFAYVKQNNAEAYISDNAGLCFMNEQEWKAQTVQYHITGNYEKYSEKDLYKLPECDVIWPGNDRYELMALRSSAKTLNGNDLAQAFQVGGDREAIFRQLAVSSKNNDWMANDLVYEQKGNEYQVLLPYSIPNAQLTQATLTYSVDGSVEFWGEGVNANGTINLLKSFYCRVVSDNGKTHVYKMTAQREKHAIPVVYITTQNGKNVTSTRNYLKGTFMMDAEGIDGINSIPLQSISIKGRGHSTWKKDKKPYALKFDEKVSIMGLDKNRDWVLLANYFDPSNSRNYVAYEMAKELPFDFTPSSYPVDVFMNGVYIGVYGIGEKIEVASSRVDLKPNNGQLETDYLIEIGAFEAGAFTIDHMTGISISHPKPEEITKEQRSFVIQYLNAANSAVKNLTNYEDYIDMDTFLDWFIMIELTYNCDSSFNRSVYITKNAGGKLEFQPMWDFDLGFGNLCILTPEYETWATTQNGFTEITWATYLLKDPHFRDLLEKRWIEVRDRLLERGLKACDQMSEWMNAGSGKENFDVWVTPGERIGWEWDFVKEYETTEEHIDYVRRFIKMRKAYLDRIIVDREEPTTYIKPPVVETKPDETAAYETKTEDNETSIANVPEQSDEAVEEQPTANETEGPKEEESPELPAEESIEM